MRKKQIILVSMIVTTSLFVGCTDFWNNSPVAKITSEDERIEVGYIIYFSGSSSYDSDGYIDQYQWDIFTNYSVIMKISNESNLRYKFNETGSYRIRLTVTDDEGKANSTTLEINVMDRYYNIEYGNFILPLNEEIINGDYLFKFSNNKIFSYHEDDASFLYKTIFEPIYNGSLHGIKGFQMEIINLSDDQVVVNISNYQSSNFLGKGNFHFYCFNSSFKFVDGNSFILRKFNENNDSALIEEVDGSEHWIQMKEPIDLGFIVVNLRIPFMMECK